MTCATNKSMSALEWGLLVTLSVLWGGSFFFVAIAVEELPPLTIVVLRVAIAAVALLALLRLLGLALPADHRVWAAFAAMGLLNNALPFTLIVWSQTHIAGGVAAILNATTPLFTVLLAHGLTHDEKITGGRVAGILIAFVGAGVLIGATAMQSADVNVVAQLACLVAAISYALAAIYGRHFRALGIAPMVTATGQVAASSLMLLPVMLAFDQPWRLPMPSIGTLAALLGLALLSTALAYILYFRILATAGATNVLLVTFLVPVSAIVLGFVFLGEALASNHLVGMALIGLGLTAIDGRLWRKRRALWALRPWPACGRRDG